VTPSGLPLAATVQVNPAPAPREDIYLSIYRCDRGRIVPVAAGSRSANVWHDCGVSYLGESHKLNRLEADGANRPTFWNVIN